MRWRFTPGPYNTDKRCQKDFMMSSGVSPVRFLMVSSVTLMISCAVLLRNFRSLSMYGFVETINGSAINS